MIGTTLGRYRLEASLGRGGMAEVFKAHDERLGRTVAVKVILPAFAAQPDFTERFLRESRLVAGLEHPHILPVYDSGDEQGTPYLVMPYLQGGTLVERMAAGALPTATALRWIGELADALDAAHARGVTHRDVKPANVLLGTGDRALLADFGIAKSVGAGTQITATGVVIGTPTYMAPELAKGESASPASDLYAFAVLAYEMLTGAPPFSGESALSLLHQHVSTPPPRPSLRGTLPPAVDAVFARALAKEPERRFANCREFASELDRVLAPAPGTGETTRASIATARTMHMPTPSRGVPAAAAAPRRGMSWLGVLGILVVLLGALALWQLLGAPPPPQVGRVETPSQPPAPATAEPPVAPTGERTTEPPVAPPAPQPIEIPTAVLEAPANDPTATVAPPEASLRPEPAPGGGVSTAPESGRESLRPGGRRDGALNEVGRQRLQEVERRGRETSPREALTWLHGQYLLEGIPEPRATIQTVAAARRLYGVAMAGQVLQQACQDGIAEACAELRKRGAQRPR